MNFGTPSKLACAVRIAAALGFVGLVNLERVGVGVLRERVAEGWPPTRGRNQITGLVDFLAAVRPAGGTSLNEALANYAGRSRQTGLAVVISDLLDPAGYEAGIRALLERRFDVHLVHVLAPEEMNPELAGDLRLIDSETSETRELSMDGDAVRAYRERLRQYLDRVETFCRTKEIGYHRMTSDSPVESFVLAQLRGRVVA
jgi:uncharacterized protein (DUF58 family)